MDNVQQKLQKITPFLWFKEDAEEVSKHYAAIFKGAQPGPISRFGGNGEGQQGGYSSCTLRLPGLDLVLFAGPAPHALTSATSLCVSCENQQELDFFWEKLSEGGQGGQCGWLTDKFGLSWQVVPANMEKLLHGPDQAGCGRAMQAMMHMSKLNIAELEQAYHGSYQHS